jgi:hypothetical protein
MPPRRSCFSLSPRPANRIRGRFNATTAFLLPQRFPIRSLPARSRVSMPPRRSCFSPRSPRPHNASGFQCHHGVPASLVVYPNGWAEFFRMFQCHHGVPASLFHPARRAELFWFQCHHGVPASLTEWDDRSGRISVSMPPRRSCFPLPPGRTGAAPSVSMPPRRSCFSPRSPRPHNASGFQCHHGVPASWGRASSRWRTQRFQCHHGVPASRGVFAARRGSFPFQCHHGVPASGHRWVVLNLSAFRRVSMPPRRSCFAELTLAAWIVAVSRFNATTAFLLRDLSRTDGTSGSGWAGFQCHHGVPASRN